MSTTDLVGDIARKRGDRTFLAIEAEKATRAAAIGAHTGLFSVPKVRRWDPVEGILETERIMDISSLEQLAAEGDDRLPELCMRAGLALAAVHEALELPADLRLPLPIEGASVGGQAVHIHGDFNGANVCFDRSRDRLILLDWSSAPALGKPRTYGSRYFDIMWFGFFFYRFQPIRKVLRWRPAEWLDCLIEGYSRAAGDRFRLTDYLAYRDAWSPFLRVDYKAQCARRAGGGVKRAPYWFREWATWRAWRSWHRNGEQPS